MSKQQQLNAILMALNKQKDSMLLDLGKVESLIKLRMASIKKIINYQSEYNHKERYQLSRSIPSLSKNMSSFADKIKALILNEQQEVERLIITKNIKLNEITIINKKIDYFTELLKNSQHKAHLALEKNDQVTLDDLSALKHTWGDK